MKQRERLFFIYMIFSLRSFKKSIRSPSKYICNICERVQSGKEKELHFEQRHSEWLSALIPSKLPLAHFVAAHFICRRRIEKEQEEEEDVNIKFLLSCSTHHIYVFSSCSINVEQAMSDIEIVNKRGIPHGLLYLKDKFKEPILDTVCNIRIN